MKRLLFVLMMAVLTLTNVQAGGVMYGGNGGHSNSDSINDGFLVTIDQVTSAVTVVGHPAGVSRLRGLAFDLTGALYATTQGPGGFPPPPGPITTSSGVHQANQRLPCFPQADRDPNRPPERRVLHRESLPAELCCKTAPTRTSSMSLLQSRKAKENVPRLRAQEEGSISRRLNAPCDFPGLSSKLRRTMRTAGWPSDDLMQNALARFSTLPLDIDCGCKQTVIKAGKGCPFRVEGSK